MMFEWERVPTTGPWIKWFWGTSRYNFDLHRANVPGGWLVYHPGSKAMAFYPDPDHEWDGNTLPPDQVTEAKQMTR